jgi:RNA polymerase sigma-70 factor, ECF subfamily
MSEVRDESGDAMLLRAARHDPAPFAEFYDRHARRLYGWLVRETGDPHVAADLMAETFAQALLSLPKFRGKTSKEAVAWLFGIARNLLAQFRRRNRVEASARERLEMPPREWVDEGFQAVEDRLSAESLGPSVRDEIEKLGSDHSSALRLRVVEQMSYQQIAARLGCTRTAARMRVSRALAVLSTRVKGVR